MKTKLQLIFIAMFFTISAMSSGQDTIRSLVITEWRGDSPFNAYIELTNMGDTELDLSEFTLGKITHPGRPPENQPSVNIKRLEGILPAGETYLAVTVAEGSEPWIYPPGYPKNHPRINAQADLKVYLEENDGSLIAAGLLPEDDSISHDFQNLLNAQRGERASFLYHHVSPEDSVIVDGVGLVFHPENGALIFSQFKDVAGVSNASETHILVRKFSVKEGNPNWQETRGATPEESEWIPVPFRAGWFEPYSGEYTLAGNHGVYTINDNSVKPHPDVPLDIDFTNQIITVPWGTYRDTISLTPWQIFDFGDGLAWWYELNDERADSVHAICQSGDIFRLYAVGNELQQIDFTINVAPPTNDMNQIFPLRGMNSDGFYTEGQYYIVTQNDPVIDSILNVPFALRVDSLLIRLEIAPGASWEVEWVDGIARPDVKYGDKIVVTAADNSIKEYFIVVNDYEPSSNANLGAITWPDIPEYLIGGSGWSGDTIPGFQSSGYIYEITVPFGINTVPALVPHTQNTNARVVVDRATSLSGSLQDRTTTFTVYAENDSIFTQYRVMFKKEVLQTSVQPFHADPFFSQVLRHAAFNNHFVEIFNPGNQNLDLSRYMLSFGFQNATPAEIIQATLPFEHRYVKYVPGLKLSDDEDVYNGDQTFRTDLAVDPILGPNKTWVMGNFAEREDRRLDFLEAVTDFHLSAGEENVWGLTYDGAHVASVHVRRRFALYIFRIENDSIIQGLKAPNDPNDFKLVDVFGQYPNPDPILYNPAGIPSDWSSALSTRRKSHIWNGNIESRGSFGTNAEDSEWTVRYRDIYDGSTTHLSAWEWCSEGLGIHHVDPITEYRSTISSLVYLVSDGYTDGQTIRGIESGTSVTQMLSNILKDDEGQFLKVISASDDSEKTGDDELVDEDILLVTSADSTNQTEYILDVGNPLDDNAVITSDIYDISIDGAEGFVTGFSYGTTISSVLDNITVPGTAVLNIINQHNSLIPLNMLNSDTVYVETQVHDNVYFEVVAQNGTTKITYKLIPESGSDDAFVISDVYEVNQDLFIINYINNNTAVPKLLENVIPVKGASIRVVDKAGFEREKGFLAYDDLLEVVSESGEVTNYYFLGFKSQLEIQSSLAYIVSDVYTVNQVEYTITATDITTTEVSVSDFIAALTPALGASMVVTDSTGAEITGGNMETGYLVVVTSENGLNTVTYEVTIIITSVYKLDMREINMYPNPTKDILYIDGLAEGDIVRIYNIVGVIMDVLPFDQIPGYISLDGLQSGIYFIEVNSPDKRVQTFRVIKQMN